MPKRVTFSGSNQLIAQIALHHRDIENALRQYFSITSDQVSGRFVGYSRQELKLELQNRLDELELTSSLALLASFEATLRVDYLRRCYEKRKDPVSLEMRSVYKQRGARAGLEEGILSAWRRSIPGSKRLVDDLLAAYKFRHWLAHGRYWTPKLGARRFDFHQAYTLVHLAGEQFGLPA